MYFPAGALAIARRVLATGRKEHACSSTMKSAAASLSNGPGPYVPIADAYNMGYACMPKAVVVPRRLLSRVMPVHTATRNYMRDEGGAFESASGVASPRGLQANFSETPLELEQCGT
jgi:hypothetical protein